MQVKTAQVALFVLVGFLRGGVGIPVRQSPKLPMTMGHGPPYPTTPQDQTGAQNQLIYHLGIPKLAGRRNQMIIPMGVPEHTRTQNQQIYHLGVPEHMGTQTGLLNLMTVNDQTGPQDQQPQQPLEQENSPFLQVSQLQPNAPNTLTPEQAQMLTVLNLHPSIMPNQPVITGSGFFPSWRFSGPMRGVGGQPQMNMVVMQQQPQVVRETGSISSEEADLPPVIYTRVLVPVIPMNPNMGLSAGEENALLPEGLQPNPANIDHVDSAYLGKAPTTDTPQVQKVPSDMPPVGVQLEAGRGGVEKAGAGVPCAPMNPPPPEQSVTPTPNPRAGGVTAAPPSRHGIVGAVKPVSGVAWGLYPKPEPYPQQRGDFIFS